MNMSKTRVRSKVLESVTLRNKITKNIEGIKEDIALLKKIMEKMINIYQHLVLAPLIYSSNGDGGIKTPSSFRCTYPSRINLLYVGPSIAITRFVFGLYIFDFLQRPASLDNCLAQ
ncbi:hypothetical protein Glove_117g272 [Diversispora epigaea]|uniref:Uncharacterized protein n=1 Tax=Diversispora epigaea TaxID=1348612 RepID=A0A397J0E3_9GLOM|nr:hypothetical protein Glove_117g272 [Diversispora epigaea]